MTSLLVVQKTRVLLSIELRSFIKDIFEKDQGLNHLSVLDHCKRFALAKEVGNIRAAYGEFYIHRQDVFETV